MRHLLLMTKQLQTFMALNAHCNQQGIFVHNTTTVADALAALNNHSIVAIVWDLTVTDLNDNLKSIGLIRQQFQGPILTLTSKKNIDEELQLFDLGIDDYFHEPFEFEEIMAVLTRRLVTFQQSTFQPVVDEEPPHSVTPAKTSNHQIKFADLIIDLNHYQVSRDDADLGLTPKEFKLLQYLIKHKDQVLSREQLLAGVWDYNILGTSRMVDIHISHLRDKIEPDPQNPIWLKTVRGFGYVLKSGNA